MIEEKVKKFLEGKRIARKKDPNNFFIFGCRKPEQFVYAVSEKELLNFIRELGL